jgi:hypothetical protein
MVRPRKPRIRPWESVTLTRHTLYPQKLALTYPISCSRSVGIVRSLTKAMELVIWYKKCICLRNCAIIQKFPGSIHEEVVHLSFFNLPNPANHTMTLRLTQPLTEMNTRNLPGR